MKTPIALPISELKPALIGLGKVIPKRITLPVLGAVRIERNVAGWITLTGTDLDSYGTCRLEQPSAGEPATVLLPHQELVKITKNCGKDDTISVWSDGEASEAFGIISYPIGGQTVEQRCPSFAAEEFPPLPEVNTDAVPLPVTLRTSLSEAFAFASDDDTRLILNSAFLDVSDSKGHYVVSTDGYVLYGSNSFTLPLKNSVIVPAHRFLGWKEFHSDGEWQIKTATADDKSWFQISTRRWSFSGRQAEGNYPNWRQVVPASDAWKTKVQLEPSTVAELIRTVERLPYVEQSLQTIPLKVVGKTAYLIGKNTNGEATQVEIADAEVRGPESIVWLKRRYVIQALSFGLNLINIADSLTPVRFSHGGRQLIVMPVRPESVIHKPAAPKAAQPEKEETMPRNITPTAAPGTNGNGSNGHSTEEQQQKPALELALDQIETIKTSIRAAKVGLNGLPETLTQVQREQKASEKEVEGVRATWRSSSRCGCSSSLRWAPVRSGCSTSRSSFPRSALNLLEGRFQNLTTFRFNSVDPHDLAASQFTFEIFDCVLGTSGRWRCNVEVAEDLPTLRFPELMQKRSVKRVNGKLQAPLSGLSLPGSRLTVEGRNSIRVHPVEVTTKVSLDHDEP